MTARLVALMSAVLFLSLLAFSLLLDHSRAAVLERVENTVRTVGNETLHAMYRAELDFDGASPTTDLVRGMPMPPGFWATESRLHIVRERRSAADAPNPQDAECDVELTGSALRGFVIAHDDPQTIQREGGEIEVKIAFLAAGRWQNDMPDMRLAADPRATGDPAAATSGEFVPAVDPAVDPARPASPIRVEAMGDVGDPATATRDELVFRVPVDEYGRVFDAIRERMIWLFGGVLLLGVALSTAVARRFTRPIRDLDQALQRVTAGDLDVAVQPAGGPEVGRLAVAFNTMTAELRKNRDRERELIRREKMSALGRLAAGVAHDVRNPLHSIGLTLQNLEEACRPEVDEKRGVFERAVGLIRREVKRLDSLVAGFLAFARADAGAKQTVKLPELVRETANLVAKESERRGITVVVDAEPTLNPIAASPASLRSAILNLVLNSFEATPRGGTVTLRVTSDGGAQIVEVADNGRGIPEGDRERVFEFGFTTREGGTGLGLAMVHHTIVEEHGGRVCIDSIEGKGTRIRLELPDGSAS